MPSPVICRTPEGQLTTGSDDNPDHMATMVWRPAKPGSSIVVQDGVYVEVQHDGSRQVLFKA